MSALLLLAVVAAVLPAGTLAEQASDPSEPAAALIDVGKDHSCAVFDGGDVRCWGFGGNGRLGYGNLHTVGDDETHGTAGPVELGGDATAIAAGDAHNCALLSDGSVRCWGFATNGRLGYPGIGDVGDNETPGSVGPVDLDPDPNTFGVAKRITVGGHHSCAVLDNDTVRCWGYGEYGALGYGGEANAPSSPARPPDIGDNETPGSVGPVDLDPGPGLGNVEEISAGGYHTCALLVDGTVRCWGWGGSGQLGTGSSMNVSDPSKNVSDPSKPAEPVFLGDGRKAVAISAGETHTCAVLDNGNVLCWGSGQHGRLGYGNQDAVGDRPAALPGFRPALTFPAGGAAAITAGANHTCARLRDSTVRCWGLGVSGQLGYANRDSFGDGPGEAPGSAPPVNLGADRTASAISAGGSHTCARLEDRVSVSCWGYGGNGRLGYCNERSVGDDEAPGSVGRVPHDIAVRAPDATYPGCARAAGDSGVPQAPAPKPPVPAAPAADTGASALSAQALRMKELRSCLARAGRHARLEIRRARRSSARGRAALKRHIKRHRAQKRRACLRRHGRTPGRVEGLTARAASSVSVVLGFGAAGTDGGRPPAARDYVVKQSRRPIRGSRAFRRAQTLCNGRCRFPASSEVGRRLSLTVEDLRPRTTYYYAVAARDNVSGRVGPRSAAVKVTTR